MTWFYNIWLSLDVDIVGNYQYSGIVKIYFGHNASEPAQEGFLCDDDAWTYNTAKVVCKQAGYKGIHKIRHNAEER